MISNLNKYNTQTNNILFVFFVFCLLFNSCNERVNKQLPKEESYFLYKHVKEKVDSDNITIGYDLLDTPLTKQEVDSLVIILKQYGWNYKITKDEHILISMISIHDLDELLMLDAELAKKIRQ